MPEYVMKEKLTERDIILEYLREIGKKFLNEFRSSYEKTVVHGDWTERVYVPDSRKEAIQAIEFFSDLLRPHFDDKMQKQYDIIMRDADKLLKDYEGDKIDHEKYVVQKLRLMRKLFQHLSQLLKDTQYLRKKARIG